MKNLISMVTLLVAFSVNVFSQTDGVTFRRSTGNVIQTNLNQAFLTITNHAATPFRVLSSDANKKVISLNVTTDGTGDNLNVPGDLTADDINANILYITNISPGTLVWIDQNGALTNVTFGPGVTFNTNTGTLYGGVLNRSGALTGPVNTTAETAIYTNTIPGGAMGTNGSVTLDMIGTWKQNSGIGTPTFVIKVYYGSTLVYSDSSIAISDSAFESRFQMIVTLANRGSASSQWCHINFQSGGRGTAATGTGAFDTAVGTSQWIANVSGVALENSANDLGFGVTIAWNNSTNTLFRTASAILRQN